MRGMRSAGLCLLLVPGAIFGARMARAEEAASPATLPSVVIVLDSSKHMSDKIGGAPKFSLIRSSLGEALAGHQEKLGFGLVAFGYRQTSNCADTQTLAKIGELNGDTDTKLLANLKPKGQSPIAAALSEAVKLGEPGGKLDVVLVAGSLDSCKADVCATVSVLKQKSPGLRFHVIAFDDRAKDELAPLHCIADQTGGEFAAASNQDELQQGLSAILDSIANPPPPPAAPPVAATGGAPAPPVPAASIESTAMAKPAPSGASGLVAQPGPNQPEAQTSLVSPSAANPAAPPNAPVPVTFRALLTETGPKVQAGVTWRVFASQKAPNGAHKLLSTNHEATPTEALPPGEYLVNAAYGLSNVTKKIEVESGRNLEETFILNTGALKLSAALATGEPLPANAVHFDIMSDEEDQFGNRRKILGDAKPGVTIRLNAGAYHVVSRYGDANATVQADVTVEPGKLTEATVKQAAAPVTFKLVEEAGGEALADTQWSVITPTGDVVKETTGALPTHILAAGKYAVVAQHGGLSYTNKFNVVTGQPKEVELVVEEGPTSPEALRAITNPPPPPAPPDEGEGSLAGAPSPDSGAAFDGGSEPSGPLINPGILLRPTLR